MPAPNTMPHAETRREIEIDLLRILAASVVVLYHYFYRGPLHGLLPASGNALLTSVSAYGYLGVNIFFVISGYVIFLTAIGTTPARFLASRVSRLYPAFITCLAITYASHLYFGTTKDASLPSLLANMTIIPQWFGFEGMDGTYWSLEREIVFYGMIFALLCFGKLERIRFFIAAWLVLATIESFRRIWLLEIYALANWASFFSAGMLLRLIQRGARDKATFALLGWAIILSLYLTWRDAAYKLHIPIPQITVVIMVFAFVLFVAIALGRFQMKSSRWPSRWILLASAWSYPLYLIHHDLGYHLAGSGLFSAVPPSLRGVVLLPVMLVLTVLVHHGVEKRAAKPLKTIILRGCERLQQFRHAAL
jgi:peptidoglycan/LPS O-acetylase OafA/YrhL